MVYFWMPPTTSMSPWAAMQVEADAADVAEELVERRRLRVQGGEDEALVAVDLRRVDQAPVLAVELLVVDVLEAGDADEVALQVVGPAVVGAHERGRVALFGPADGVAAVAAGVQQDLGLPSLSRTTMTRSSPMKVMKKSPGFGIWRLVGHEVPGAREDVLELELVDVLVGEDPAVDEALLVVDHLEVVVRLQGSSGHGLPSHRPSSATYRHFTR